MDFSLLINFKLIYMSLKFSFKSKSNGNVTRTPGYGRYVTIEMQCALRERGAFVNHIRDAKGEIMPLASIKIVRGSWE